MKDQQLVDYTQCRSCATCKWGLYTDVGYSNYTVEGTHFDCMAGKHPSPGFDAFYGHDIGFAFGMKCEHYAEGVGIHMDVEGENIATLTPDEKIRLDISDTGGTP
jgi:hypothetical protein